MGQEPGMWGTFQGCTRCWCSQCCTASLPAPCPSRCMQKALGISLQSSLLFWTKSVPWCWHFPLFLEEKFAEKLLSLSTLTWIASCQDQAFPVTVSYLNKKDLSWHKNRMWCFACFVMQEVTWVIIVFPWCLEGLLMLPVTWKCIKAAWSPGSTARGGGSSVSGSTAGLPGAQLRAAQREHGQLPSRAAGGCFHWECSPRS